MPLPNCRDSRKAVLPAERGPNDGDLILGQDNPLDPLVREDQLKHIVELVLGHWWN
ncbi:MAG: hypothetical protein Q8M02_04835 [Candidatus Didemnitutus sp.]|nr:hypothetical protein [Candidatus Didemnitutus sp.]